MGVIFGRRGQARRTGGLRCPRCGSANVERVGGHIEPLPGRPFPELGSVDAVPVSEYRCLDCGHAWDEPFG